MSFTQDALNKDALAQITIHARTLVTLAERLGIVVSIEQVADKPLAMGHYHTQISVRLKRKLGPAMQDYVTPQEPCRHAHQTWNFHGGGHCKDCGMYFTGDASGKPQKKPE